MCFFELSFFTGAERAAMFLPPLNFEGPGPNTLPCLFFLRFFRDHFRFVTVHGVNAGLVNFKVQFKPIQLKVQFKPTLVKGRPYAIDCQQPSQNPLY